jgi:SSS family solute:Na+ symporter
MHWLDWLLIAIPLLVVFGAGAYTRRYMKSVADFLSGGRLAGRYLLTVSRGEMQAGAVVFAASFEVISHSGFTLNWWNVIGPPIWLFFTISGFVIYRYRETRALTLAQFFEIRYSKAFRLFTGVLGFFAGLINFGIIPAVGARIFVYFLGLPVNVHVFGYVIPTYIFVMAGFLCITLALTLAGGLITVMITDCLEGIFSQILYLVIIAGLLTIFSWSQISEVLGNRPPGQSLLNPFDSAGLKDFNLMYVLMSVAVGIYGTMAWQNQSSYNAAALTPHESRMSSVLGQWREYGKIAVVTLLGVCALTYLQHPDFAQQAATVHAQVGEIPQPQIQEQMRAPIALSELLPVGIKGAFCVILLMGIFGGDSTHLHSWGGLFVQDVLVPLRKKPFTPKQHIMLLRLSITGVALFAFLFGSLFRQTEYIVMWWSVTMGVFIGGAGSAIIGGLYWSRGTTAGAWTALISGSTLSIGGILLRQIYGTDFPLNGQQISFFAALTAGLLYVIVSLLTCREPFNMDRMLHRGKYAAIKELVGEKVVPKPRGKVWLGKLIGIDEDFSTADKWIASLLVGWSLFWLLVFLVGTVWNLASPWPTSVWSYYWKIVGVGLPIFFAVVTAIWFTWGGLRDILALFRRLKQERVNHLDDGTVVDHQNLDELVIVKEAKEVAKDSPAALIAK